MPITYNYEGPLASPAVDSAYRAGQRTSAQQRRSELERLQLARQQMQQNAALQQQRFQQQAMLQQQGQYGDLQRLLLTDQMRQQSQQGQYAQQMAMEEYRNQTQAERDLKYWESKENFVDYQMNSQGQQESAKIRRQIAEINASGYPDTWKQQAIGQLEAQRMGVTQNPENFTNEEFQPGTVSVVGKTRYWVNPNTMDLKELGPVEMGPSESDADLSSHFGVVNLPDGSRGIAQRGADGKIELVDPDKFISSRNPLTPEQANDAFMQIEDAKERLELHKSYGAEISKARLNYMTHTVPQFTGQYDQTTQEPIYVDMPVYNSPQEVEAQLKRDFSEGYMPPSQEEVAANDLVRESAQDVGNQMLNSYEAVTKGFQNQGVVTVPEGLSFEQAQAWFAELPPGTRIMIPGQGIRVKPEPAPGGTRLYTLPERDKFNG